MLTMLRAFSVCVTLLLAVAASPFASLPASAEPADEVAAVMAKWAKAFSEHDVDLLTTLYSKEALLWGTTAPWLRTTPDQVREYFVTAFKIPNITVSYSNQTIRIHGDTAVVAGNYTFTARRDDQVQADAVLVRQRLFEALAPGLAEIGVPGDPHFALGFGCR